MTDDNVRQAHVADQIYTDGTGDNAPLPFIHIVDTPHTGEGRIDRCQRFIQSGQSADLSPGQYENGDHRGYHDDALDEVGPCDSRPRMCRIR